MQRHSVPALYVAEVLIIPAAVALLSSQPLMGLAHAAAEHVGAHTALLLCLVFCGLCVHHSGFVLHTCSRYLAPSPLLDGDDSYNTSQSRSSSHSDRGDANGEPSTSPPERLSLYPPKAERRDAERPMRAAIEPSGTPKLALQA